MVKVQLERLIDSSLLSSCDTLRYKTDCNAQCSSSEAKKYLTKNPFRVQVHDINIEPTPHQLRVSQVRLAKKFIIIYLSDNEFFKLSDLCQVRHLIFWLICNKVSITMYLYKTTSNFLFKNVTSHFSRWQSWTYQPGTRTNKGNK